jgi:uncharacterized membrane protein required for colicin V production
MWLDLVALGLLAGFALVGAARGGLIAGLSLLGLLLAYGSAVLAASLLGAPLARTLDTSELLAAPLAGSLGFVAGYAITAVVAALVRRRELEREGLSRSPRDRFLGAVFGAGRGCLVVLLLAWLALWVDALRETGRAPGLPALGPSAAAAVTGAVVEAGVTAALGDGDPAGRVIARMAARPGSTLAGMQGLLGSPAVEALRSDATFWTHVEWGNVDAALHRVSALRLARDDELRSRLAELGLVDEAAAHDPAVFREELAAVLHEVGPRIRALRNDPELRRLLDDPEVVALVTSGDHVGLVAHPGFQRVVSRALATPTE